MPGPEVIVVEKAVDGADELVVFELVGWQAHAEAELVHALRVVVLIPRVVVLIPEERQHDHRLSEMERLGDRVVATVRDDEVDLRKDRRLRQELLAEHVVGERDQLVLRTLAHNHPVIGLREHVDERLMRATSADPSDPSERYISAPSPGRAASTAEAASDRTREFSPGH